MPAEDFAMDSTFDSEHPAARFAVDGALQLELGARATLVKALATVPSNSRGGEPPRSVRYSRLARSAELTNEMCCPSGDQRGWNPKVVRRRSDCPVVVMR